MNADEVARRHLTRPGFRLASYGEVGLPYYRITLRAQVLERKPIGPFSEFVLRSVNDGIADPAKIGELLGIDQTVLEATMVGLLSSDDLSVGPPPGESRQQVLITKKGSKTLDEAVSVIAEEAVFDLDYDGLLRRPVPFLDRWLAPRQLKAEGIREIPPSPTKPPDLLDLSIEAVDPVIRKVGERKQASRDLLALKAIDRRKRIFQTAVVLVYRAEAGSDVQVGFAIDGRLSPQHEEAFARAKLLGKLGIGGSGLQPAEDLVAEVLGSEVVGRADAARALELQHRVAKAEVQADGAVGVAKPEGEHDPTPVDISAAKDELAAMPVRPIETFEHPAFLREAVESSQNRLLIVSPWLRQKVVNKQFVQDLERRLNAGVDVFIGWGISKEDDEIPDADFRVERDLDQLSDKYANLRFERLGDTHAKVLVCDRRFAIATSFNWLSFRGDPRRTFRDERGFLVTEPSIVDQQFEAMAKRFRNRNA